MPDEKHAEAKAVVDRFVSHFEESYRQLAYYAALPLLLTPELLNFLRGRFLRGQVPWIAEADLLLSDLCRQVGYELYAIKPAVRAYLLAEMTETVGREAMQDVARLLITYTQYLEKLDPRYRREERQAQQWAAMVYLDESREQAVRQMATALRQQVTAVTTGETLLNELEANRMTRIVETLAPELGDYQELVDFATDINSLLRERSEETAARIREKQSGRVVAGVSLEVDEEVLADVEAQAAGAADYIDGWAFTRQLLPFWDDGWVGTVREGGANLLDAPEPDANTIATITAGSKLRIIGEPRTEIVGVAVRPADLVDAPAGEVPDTAQQPIYQQTSSATPPEFVQTTTPPPDAPREIDPRKLLNTLDDYFSEVELRDLCFDLEVDYEALPADGKQAKARELIIYFTRRNRLDRLVNTMLDHRPNISRESLVKDEPDTFAAAASVSEMSMGEEDVAETAVDPTALTQLLIDTFNENELRTFCFNLDVDYDGLLPGGQQTKARALVDYFIRHRRLTELVEAVQEERPFVTLDMISPDPEIRQSTAPQTPPVSLNSLNKALIDLFDEDELRELCFDLAVDYDNLAGLNKREKSRSLIQFLQRRQQLPELLDMLRKYRPEFDFDALVLTERADVQSRVDVGGTAVPQKSDTLITGKDLSVLLRLLRQPEFRSAVINFQTEFEAASAQIDILADYKLAHDLFQELESRYFLIKSDERRLPDNDDAWDNISLNEPELHAKINDLLNIIKRPTFTTDDTRWGQQLEKARDQIRLGVEEFDVNQLQTGIHLIYRILNRQPTRLNAQIVAIANMIRLDSIENAVNTVLDGLLKSSIEANQVVDELKHSAQGLANMNERLNRLIQEHNGWQEIDDELRRVEASMNQDINELELTWFDLGSMLRNLIEPSRHEEWAAQLLKVVEAMDDAVAEDTAVNVNRQFRRLRSLAGRRFRQVDLELLSLLQDLQRSGESLDLLLRQLK